MYKCNRVECDEKSTCESVRISKKDLKNTLKGLSPIYEHCNITGHHTSVDTFSIVGGKSQTLMRTVKEGILIRVNDLSLNRNICKYHQPHIVDELC